VKGERLSIIEGLDVNEVKDGLIVYEPDRDRVHYLNGTAAVVFLFCDGANDAEDIAGLVAKAYGLDEPPSDEVADCVTQLRSEGLVR
jgi:hypothetical protein